MFDARPANAPLTKVFTQLFDSLNTELGEEYLQEALNCLIKCLEKDATCHYKWRNNYLVRLKESRWVYYRSLARQSPERTVTCLSQSNWKNVPPKQYVCGDFIISQLYRV